MTTKEIIIRMVCWISFITFIIMVIWRIFGSSPTNLEIIIPILIIISGQVVKNTVDLKGGGIHQSYNEQRLSNIETQINRIPEIEFDIKEIKNRLNKIENTIGDIPIKNQLDRIEKILIRKKKTS